jgi:hypothetical protein
MMNGHAKDGSERRDQPIAAYRLPLAWRKRKAANDNRAPLSQRVLGFAWGIIAISALCWVAWTGLR